ncbi:hypothetical protein FA15DRAFT_583626 [Coprinopsis marcescibilis]|uniref:Uncharacterized protein n=1 Tax=Coprinopsis marcescibilis TaxID=230819 RepID=A0A5C3LJU9_COPMA|nr:hypothetical protein FA15DRAFT_583626 [Coprinopsis marcescibilis]
MPQPRILVALHVFSLVWSLVIMIVSCCCDHGILSLWCSPIFGLATVAFHFTTLLIAYRHGQIKPLISAGTVVLAWIICSCWAFTFVAMVVVREAQKGGVHSIDLGGGMTVPVPYTKHGAQHWQFITVPSEWVILGNLAFRTTIYRSKSLYEEFEASKLPLYNEPAETGIHN